MMCSMLVIGVGVDGGDGACIRTCKAKHGAGMYTYNLHHWYGFRYAFVKAKLFFYQSNGMYTCQQKANAVNIHTRDSGFSTLSFQVPNIGQW